MSYVIRAKLRSARHPENGSNEILFPLSEEDYPIEIQRLGELEAGDAVEQDCLVEEIDSFYGALQCLEGQKVNVDELDYLAKLLESIDVDEGIQFMAMIEEEKLSDIKDIINLTFCCRTVTVITDFSNLEQIGKDHYMNLNGGCASIEELNNLDGEETARLLIGSGAGVVTPYGVVYDNGMKLEQVYDGRHFPEYLYEDSKAIVTLTPIDRPEIKEYLYLPCPSSKISRALQRLGVASTKDCHATLNTDDICDAVRGVFEKEFELTEYIETLNQLTKCYKGFDADMLEKFHTVFDYAWPANPEEVVYLAQNIGDFTVVPHISTAEEYGQYLVRASGRYELDPNLDEYINYRKLGEHRIQEEGGAFSDRGYVAYGGTNPQILGILFRQGQTQEMKMGGLYSGIY